jgi:hypothetical protein
MPSDAWVAPLCGVVGEGTGKGTVTSLPAFCAGDTGDCPLPLRKPFSVSFDLLVKPLRRNTIKLGKVSIEHDLLAANQKDLVRDRLYGDEWLG